MLNRLQKWSRYAALAFVLAGCGDDKPKDAATASADATSTTSASAPELKAAKSLADVKMPAEVVVIGGADDPSKILDGLTKTIASVQPGGDPLNKTVADVLGETYALGPEAFDLSKPVQVAVFDPKKHTTDPLVVVVRVGSKEKLLAAAKGAPVPDAGDGLVGWGSSFARVEGDVATISKDKEILKTHAPFLKELASAPSGAGATVVVPMQHIGTLYGADIEALTSQAKLLSPPEDAQGIEIGTKFVTSTVKELKHLSINLKPTDDGLMLDIAAEPTALSTWRAAFQLMKAKGESKVAAKLPASSVVAASASLPPESRPLMKKYLEWVGTMPGGGGMKGALAAWEEAWDALTGELAMVVFTHDGKPAVLAVSGVTDAAKVRDAQRKASETMVAAPPTDDLKKLKVKMSFKKAAYKVGDVEVDVTKTEFGNPPPGMEKFMAWMGEAHAAVTPTESIVSYGPGAKAVVEAYIGGKLPGGLDTSPLFSRAKRGAVKDALALFAVSPNDLATMAGLPVSGKAEAPVTVSLGASDGVLHIGFELPAAQLPAIAVGFGALQSAAMESMKPGGPGGPPGGLGNPTKVSPKNAPAPPR
jgi:hypothetical protein